MGIIGNKLNRNRKSAGAVKADGKTKVGGQFGFADDDRSQETGLVPLEAPLRGYYSMTKADAEAHFKLPRDQRFLLLGNKNVTPERHRDLFRLEVASGENGYELARYGVLHPEACQEVILTAGASRNGTAKLNAISHENASDEDVAEILGKTAEQMVGELDSLDELARTVDSTTDDVAAGWAEEARDQQDFVWANVDALRVGISRLSGERGFEKVVNDAKIASAAYRKREFSNARRVLGI